MTQSFSRLITAGTAGIRAAGSWIKINGTCCHIRCRTSALYAHCHGSEYFMNGNFPEPVQLAHIHRTPSSPFLLSGLIYVPNHIRSSSSVACPPPSVSVCVSFEGLDYARLPGKQYDRHGWLESDLCASFFFAYANPLCL